MAELYTFRNYFCLRISLFYQLCTCHFINPTYNLKAHMQTLMKVKGSLPPLLHLLLFQFIFERKLANIFHPLLQFTYAYVRAWVQHVENPHFPSFPGRLRLIFYFYFNIKSVPFSAFLRFNLLRLCILMRAYILV